MFRLGNSTCAKAPVEVTGLLGFWVVRFLGFWVVGARISGSTNILIVGISGNRAIGQAGTTIFFSFHQPSHLLTIYKPKNPTTQKPLPKVENQGPNL